MRVKITLSYDGSRFAGFQIQKETKDTVAQKIEDSFKSAGIENRFVASGRTDKGVHATGQVLHIDLPSFWTDLDKLKNILNRSLLPHIYIKKIEKVQDTFHARFDAKKRVYRYIVSTQKPSVFLTPYITYINRDIDFMSIKNSIKEFEGRYDFEYFKKNGSDTKNFVRSIYRADCYMYKDFYVFYFEGDGFLRSQIRMMVDFLFKISEGKLSKNELKLQLQKKKVFSTSLAPPQGLYLSKIKYGA